MLISAINGQKRNFHLNSFASKSISRLLCFNTFLKNDNLQIPSSPDL